eukprot:Skav230446  [mRNA]  locus=scaffold3496:112156:119103:- [translate_table: standard]
MRQVSPQRPPCWGGDSRVSLEAGGAVEREVQADPVFGASVSFSETGQRLVLKIRRILQGHCMRTLSLSQVGSCLLQCLSECCKPWSMADDSHFVEDQTSLADTVSGAEPIAVWGQATGLALSDMASGCGAQQPSKDALLRHPEMKKSVERQLQRFDMWEEEIESCSFEKIFSSKGVDYSGEMVRLAQPLNWTAVANSLPEGVGKLKLEEFCVSGTKHYVENFEEYLIPFEDQVLPKAPRVQVEEGSWDALCAGLTERGICEFTPISQLHHIDDAPLLNGLFAVGKNEFKDGLETQRLIMNLTAANSICKGLQGDMSTLPTLSNLNVLTVTDDQEIVISSEDVRCFFYLFSVPLAWRKYLGFNRAVSDHLLPPSLRGVPCVLSACVLPMGFCNSVAIAQHVHRNVTKWAMQSMDTPIGGEGEIRRDKGFPSSHQLWRIYLDNFDQLEIQDAQTADVIKGTPSPQILAMRQAYERLSLPRHPAKAVERQERAEVQGALVLGKLAVAIPKPAKVLQYLGLGLELLRNGKCTLRELQVVIGGFVYLATFRRPVLGALNEVWRFMETFKGFPPVVRLQLPDLVTKEVVRFLCLIPLCQIFFGCKLSPTVSCSDASQSGGGLVASSGLTPYGERAAQTTIRGDVPEDHDWVQVLSVGLFDGIGALRVACDALALPMCGHISIEQNKTASRVVEAFFPDTVFHDDICTVDLELVKNFALKFSNAGLVLVGAGPPCQGVSKLNADKRGALRDQRSVLFKHVPRVVQLFRLCFPWAQVHFVMESVASMSDEDCAVMSQEVELLPWEIDALGFALCRRPRLYWTSWELEADAETDLVAPEEQWGQRGQCVCHNVVSPTAFLEEGWTLAGDSLPTFTTARPSEVPGRKPAGLHKLTATEKERWTADAHRFPPYQYAQRQGLLNKHGDWRLPNVSEREAMMGFPIGYTKLCWPKALQRGWDYENQRMTLLGNSWQVGVVTWLISQLGARLGLCDKLLPSQVVGKLTPGIGSQLQSLLLRPPLQPQRSRPRNSPWEGVLVKQLLGVASIRGEDLMLQGVSEPSVKFHRLRQSIPGRLWRWRDIASWQWSAGSEHINILEMRAILTSIKWRIQKAVSPGKICEEEMGKVNKHVEGRTEAQRAKVRRTLGPLRTLTVQPKTRSRYEAARSKFYQFLKDEQLSLPRRREALDPLLAEYIEHLWFSGKGRALASDTVAGLQDLDPRLKGAYWQHGELMQSVAAPDCADRLRLLLRHRSVAARARTDAVSPGTYNGHAGHENR